jgi:hypothetical protein
MSIALILSLLALILAILEAFVPGRYLLIIAVVLLAVVNLIGAVHV